MAKEYRRENPLLSLCGLNCGLCPNYQDYTNGAFQCPGCGGEDFYPKHPTCATVTCAQRHGGIEYCYQCAEYPCQRYTAESEYDLFITHRNALKDFDKARRIGIDAYRAEQMKKMATLKELLARYNDGRKKSFYCTALNLMELHDIADVMIRIAEETRPGNSDRENAALAARLFQEKADEIGLSIRLNRKKKG